MKCIMHTLVLCQVSQPNCTSSTTYICPSLENPSSISHSQFGQTSTKLGSEIIKKYNDGINVCVRHSA